MTEPPDLIELLELSGETDVSIIGEEGIVSSHFRVSEAAASALAACGVGANTIWRLRGAKIKRSW